MSTTPRKKARTPRKSAAARAAQSPPHDENVTLIKKYGNRRLYDTRRSKYVTLDELAEVLSHGEEIAVVDATTHEDVTKRVLTQIILHEEENRQRNLLPIGFLKKLIQFKDEDLKDYFQRYLTSSLDAYLDAQKTMAQRVGGWAATAMDPKMMGMMFPWLNLANPQPPPAAQPSPPAPPKETVKDELAELRARLAELEARYKRS